MIFNRSIVGSFLLVLIAVAAPARVERMWGRVSISWGCYAACSPCGAAPNLGCHR
jgi:hypothetical protein